MRSAHLKPSVVVAFVLALCVAASPGGAGRGEAAQLSAASFSTVTWEAHPGEFGAGFADFMVGAPLYDNIEQDSGRVFVYLGGASSR